MVKFGVTLANASRRVSPEHAATLAQVAEETGYESLWTVEHTVVPGGYESRYPYDESGRMPGSEEAPIADPLIWLAWAAAKTTSLKLATGILILPQRNPVTLAKEVATLDILSGGRVILGIGVGWLKEEFDVLGVPFEERGARTDEFIQIMRTMWTDDEPAFDGQFMQFKNAKSYPKPVQKPVPIVIGGHSEAAAKRAGRIAEGFYPYNAGDPEETLRLVQVMRDEAVRNGRDPDTIELTTIAGRDMDANKRFVDAGIHRIIVPPIGKTPEELRGFLDVVKSTLG